MTPDEARKLDPGFQGGHVFQEVRILLSEQEALAAKLVMASVQEWISNEIHTKLKSIVTNVVNDYMFYAMDKGCELPTTKEGILRMALNDYKASCHETVTDDRLFYA